MAWKYSLKSGLKSDWKLCGYFVWNLVEFLWKSVWKFGGNPVRVWYYSRNLVEIWLETWRKFWGKLVEIWLEIWRKSSGNLVEHLNNWRPPARWLRHTSAATVAPEEAFLVDIDGCILQQRPSYEVMGLWIRNFVRKELFGYRLNYVLFWL